MKIENHIAIDLDDVVLDFVGMLCRALSREYDFDISTEDIMEWDLSKKLDPIVGGPWWEWWKERDWLWAIAEPVKGAIGGLRSLRQEGFFVEIITHKPQWARAQTTRWLGKWRPTFDRLTILDPDMPKSRFTEARVLIDDKPANCDDFLDAGRQAALFFRPHNRLDADFYHTLYNWQDILTFVRNMRDGGHLR